MIGAVDESDAVVAVSFAVGVPDGVAERERDGEEDQHGEPDGNEGGEDVLFEGGEAPVDLGQFVFKQDFVCEIQRRTDGGDEAKIILTDEKQGKGDDVKFACATFNEEVNAERDEWKGNHGVKEHGVGVIHDGVKHQGV